MASTVVPCERENLFLYPERTVVHAAAHVPPRRWLDPSRRLTLVPASRLVTVSPWYPPHPWCPSRSWYSLMCVGTLIPGRSAASATGSPNATVTGTTPAHTSIA
jgi:hypothetical protein